MDRVEWRILPDSATIAAAMQQGEIDWWLYPDGRVEQILLYTREKTTVQGGSYLHGIPAKGAFLRISVDNYPVDKSGLYLRRADGS